MLVASGPSYSFLLPRHAVCLSPLCQNVLTAEQPPRSLNAMIPQANSCYSIAWLSCVFDGVLACVLGLVKKQLWSVPVFLFGPIL